MKGLELSRSYFKEYGEPMLRDQFPGLLPYLACGLTGSGSECFGFDDDISQDHDFEPGFCIFLPGEETVDRRSAFALERAYSKLPREFQGFRRSLMSPVGGARHGVIRTAEFFNDKTGFDSAYAASGRPDRTALFHWLSLPDSALAEAVNGEIWFDNCGEVTKWREALAAYPADIRRKKLAGNLLLMAQSGQYNYTRCLSHGEPAAAQLAVMEYVRCTIQVIFLLNNRYMPYYKWAFRSLRSLPLLALDAELLEYLITTDNEKDTAEEKYNVIEGIASDIIDELTAQELTKAACGDLEKHAYSVNDGIADPGIRNLHILAAV